MSDPFQTAEIVPPSNSRIATGLTTLKNTTPKKIEIPNIDSFCHNPNERFEHNWKALEGNILDIFYERKSDIPYQTLYEYVEEICANKQHEMLFQRFSAALESYFDHELTEIYNVFSNPNNLKLLNNFWRSFKDKMIKCSKIFSVLDRTYVIHDSRYASILNFSSTVFSKHLTDKPEIISRVVSHVLSFIQDLRNHKSIDLDLLSSSIRILVELHVYSKHFEPLFLEQTKNFYDQESQKNISIPIEEFLKNVAARIELEDNVIASLLPQTAAHKLGQIVKWESFGKHFSINLKKGFVSLLDRLETEHIKLLHKLALQVRNGEETLVTNIGSYVKERVGDIMSRSPTIIDYQTLIVQDLINLHNNLHLVVLPCFENDSTISKQITSSFNAAVNVKPAKYSEYLIKFLDSQIPKFDNVDDEMFKEFSTEIICLLKFIFNKENFIIQYKTQLASRLIDLRSSSIECEKKLVEDIKNVIGTEYTSKIDGMFRDMCASQQFSLEYHQNVAASSIESNLLILSQGFWPTYDYPEVKIPDQISSLKTHYESYYLTKDKSNRELSWPYYLSSCILEVHFDSGSKELHVKFAESLILQLFNKNDSYSINEIFLELGVSKKADETEIYSAIQSLSCGNYYILLKDPPGLKIGKTDILKFNNKFKHQAYRIKIKRFSTISDVDEKSTAVQCDYFERDLRTDALIVHFLKVNKTLDLSAILRLVSEKIKLELNESDITTRLDNLITRDYIKSDTENPHIYHYCD